MLKRMILWLLIVVTLMVSLSACRPSDGQPNESTTEAVTERTGPYLIVNGVDIRNLSF